MKRLIIIVLGLLLAGGDASAQEWVQTNGPGGDVYGMFFNKKNIFIFLSKIKLLVSGMVIEVKPSYKN